MPPIDHCLLMGRHLVTFGEGIESDLKNDILDCLLYAQSSADSLFSRSRDGWRWQEEYQRSILSTGGQPFGRGARGRLKIHDLRDLSRRAAFTELATSAELKQLLTTSFDALMSSEPARKYFDSWFASSGRSESFQVVPCEAQENGRVNILVCGLQMRTSALRPARYFWQVLGGEMVVGYSGATFRFRREAYEPARSRVQEALFQKAEREIVRL
ncbi:hypothetical protein [Pseudomonas sp. NPDC089734]|uniref:hypothetical protein n=1 Tax=Pseudomonas sp. NPDC089734 TaxID=3364469 RepID=UPI003827377A